MRPGDAVRAQIAHVDGAPVPYRFWWEGDVGERLDRHYGSPGWRERPIVYFDTPLHVDTLQERRVDDAHVLDGFGALWRVDRRPWHLERPPMPERSFRGWTFPEPEQFLAPIRRAIPAALDALQSDSGAYHVVGMGWGLFEQSWRIRGFENALADAVEDPGFYADLVGRVADLYVLMVRACADVPADAFFFGDDWGEQRGVILGPERWRELVKPAWKRVYDEVHAQGKTVISHSCGSVADIMGDLVEIGLDVLESVQPEARGMDPYELKRRWGGRIAFYGCLGSQSIVPFGTPDAIRAEIRRLRREMGAGGGFILSTAKGLQPETPTANAAAVLEEMTEEDPRPPG